MVVVEAFDSPPRIRVGDVKVGRTSRPHNLPSFPLLHDAFWVLHILYLFLVCFWLAVFPTNQEDSAYSIVFNCFSVFQSHSKPMSECILLVVIISFLKSIKLHRFIRRFRCGVCLGIFVSLFSILSPCFWTRWLAD